MIYLSYQPNKRANSSSRLFSFIEVIFPVFYCSLGNMKLQAKSVTTVVGCFRGWVLRANIPHSEFY